nr:hypothetical protein [Bacteroidota bacterium]
MKYFKNKLGIFLLLPAFVILFIQAPAQDNKTVQPRMNLEYFKRPGERLLKATLKAREGKQYVVLSDLPVEFNMLADTGSILLGTGYTDDNGIATFLVSGDQFDQGIYDGSVSFESTFSGSEKYKSSSSELNIRDLELNLSFIQEEDEKQIVLTAFGITGNKLIPISEDMEIIFYV